MSNKNTSHTPEPWTCDENGVIIAADKNRAISIAETSRRRWVMSPYGGTQKFGDMIAEAEANGRRITACVNACAGINPEAIPDFLALLKEAETLADGYGLDVESNPDEGLRTEAAEFAGRIRAALAKAKKGAR